ncbi:Glycosyl transferase family 2 [Cribrihabitans marinus]|uniref:Glycosyl transferase family 2 n=1 Tax=Cribrihabitans marinus TaxID=1227549 RepID=A0A1H7A644_9RHOB|nr:glycosyltransferase family 2 protein [Cribrihabitans marinus]GGH29898.1 hypothetical protein GCM10010973_19660 [Cribrihabitans marinus]SEJ57482.1 Glycosyl transferase family 2 [Cribrihabitans marinus]
MTATWGLVATVKAPTRDILRFAAHHIELGAHRLYIHLDAADPQAHAALKAHPKVRVFDCDADFWARTGKPRPDKHQVRQSANATRTYARAEVDWLAHIDVDEFLWSDRPVATQLAALPSDIFCARVRPIEALAGDGGAFKAPVPPGPGRAAIAERIYPGIGAHVPAGFLSHVQGKLFLRTGRPDVSFRIHNVYAGGVENPGQTELAGMDLCHFHAADWEHWLSLYRYRLAQGSYRSELRPGRPRPQGGMTLHDLMSLAERTDGPEGLRKIFDTLCVDTPALRERLSAEGLLRLRELNLNESLARHFPRHAQPVP